MTAEVQYRTFEMLFDGEPNTERRVKEYVSTVISEIITGERPLDDFGIPFGIGQPLGEYGEPDRSAQAQYAGAKYANEFVYGEPAIGEGSDAMYVYIQEGKTGDRRSTYSAETGEGGQYVHCISVLDGDDMPEDVRIDRPLMVEKTVLDPMAAIFRTLGWGTEWMDRAVEEATPASYHRDDDQMGLGDL